MSGTMKRKGFDELYEDFSLFSLYAPVSKIRRLDADVPLMEEQCIASVIEQQPAEEGMRGLTPDEAFPLPSSNEERALVLYRPPELPLGHSFKIDPKLRSGLKNYTDFKFWPGNSRAVVIEEAFEEENQSSSRNYLAIVPWVSFHAPITGEAVEILSSGNEAVDEQMEAEGSDGAVMEIEEEDRLLGKAGVESHTFQPWHHCMIPQHMQSTSAPIMW